MEKGYRTGLLRLVMIAAVTIISACGGSGGGTAAVPVSTETAASTTSTSAASQKAILFYAINSPFATGVINEQAKTIAVTVPFGTDVTALVASFATTGIGVKVGATTQGSGSTANNFSAPVAYTVTAEDGSTATYAVTVTVAGSSAKTITAFSIASPAAYGVIDETAKTIAVTVPSSTSVAALAAAFTTTGANVKVGGASQVSGGTTNNFTNPVVYTVTAADGTSVGYIVTVTVAPDTAKAITSFSFPALGATGVIDEASRTINVVVPYTTDLLSVVAAFTTTGASVKVGGTVQVSGTTANNYYWPQIPFDVTAADGSSVSYAVSAYAGWVDRFAGTSWGSADGDGLTTAQFTFPTGITNDGTNLYVIDGNRIRKIAIASRMVSTLAYLTATGITTDGTNLYVTSGNQVLKIVIATGAVSTVAGTVTGGFTDGAADIAQFNSPYGITTDGANLYVADSLNNAIRRIVIATGVVGTIPTAITYSPRGITTDGTYLFVGDGAYVRRVTIANGSWAPLARTNGGWCADGVLATSSLAGYTGIALSPAGGVVVADAGCHSVRTADGYTIATLSSTSFSTYGPGYLDGPLIRSLFITPNDLTFVGSTIYVTDTGSATIRRIR